MTLSLVHMSPLEIGLLISVTLLLFPEQWYWWSTLECNICIYIFVSPRRLGGVARRVYLIHQYPSYTFILNMQIIPIFYVYFSVRTLPPISTLCQEQGGGTWTYPSQFTGEGAAWSPAVQIKAGAGTLRRPIAKIWWVGKLPAPN